MKLKFMMNSDVRQSSVQNQASISVQHFLKSDPIFEGKVVAHITNLIKINDSTLISTVYIKWSLAALYTYTFLCIFIFFTLWDLYARRSHDGFQDSTVRGCGNTLGGRYSGPISIGRCVHQYTAFAPMSRRVYMLYRV